jgi:aldose 1-epimerase
MTETLRSKRATVTIAPDDGGRLTSLALDGTELLAAGTPEQGMPPGWYHGSFPMAPYAGRIKDSRFGFEGADYRLPANAGPHAGHGLVFDVPWRLVGSPAATRLVLSAQLDDRWPFGGTARQEFELDDAGLSITLELSNDSRTMPGALGFHPWFRRDLGSGPVVLGFEPAQRFAPAEDGFPRVLGTDLGERPWDDVFTGLREPPALAWPSGPRLRILSTADTWIVFEHQQGALCVEAITAPPDSLGTALSAVVGPGMPLALTVRFEWAPRHPALFDDREGVDLHEHLREGQPGEDRGA